MQPRETKGKNTLTSTLYIHVNNTAGLHDFVYSEILGVSKVPLIRLKVMVGATGLEPVTSCV